MVQTPVLLVQGAWVGSGVEELRSLAPHGTTKTETEMENAVCLSKQPRYIRAVLVRLLGPAGADGAGLLAFQALAFTCVWALLVSSHAL